MRDIDLSSKEVKILNKFILISFSLTKTEVMFSEFVKRSSDEAKSFADYSDSMGKRMGMQMIVDFFLNQSNLPRRDNMNGNTNNNYNRDFKEVLQKFRDNISFMKPLMEEDSAIKQGLKKTTDTIDTFSNILRAIENEKERRKELLRLLENC